MLCAGGLFGPRRRSDAAVRRPRDDESERPFVYMMVRSVVNDPTTGGMGGSGFTSMVHSKLVGMDFFERLGAQKPIIVRDQNLQNTWVAKGKYPIALWPSLGRLGRVMKAGAPVRLVVKIKEGTPAGSTGSGLCIFNKAPHPNAAKLFLEWLLSPQGLLIYDKITYYGAASPGSGTRISKALKGLNLVYRTEEIQLKVLELGLIERFSKALGIAR